MKPQLEKNESGRRASRLWKWIHLDEKPPQKFFIRWNTQLQSMNMDKPASRTIIAKLTAALSKK